MTARSRARAVLCAGKPTARRLGDTVAIGVPVRCLHARPNPDLNCTRTSHMNSIVYIVGAVVIVLAVLSFFGFR